MDVEPALPALLELNRARPGGPAERALRAAGSRESFLEAMAGMADLSPVGPAWRAFGEAVLSLARGRLEAARAAPAGPPRTAREAALLMRSADSRRWESLVIRTGEKAEAYYRFRSLAEAPLPRGAAERLAWTEEALSEVLLPALAAGAQPRSVLDRVLAPIVTEHGGRRSHTELFREGERWAAEARDFLRRRAIPDALRAAARGARPSLTIKSMGASIGLEPRALAAMLYQELLRAGQNPAGWDVRVEGYDLNPVNLVLMRAGVYPLEPLRAPARAFLGGEQSLRSAGPGWGRIGPELIERWLAPIWIDLADESLWPLIAARPGQLLSHQHMHRYLPGGAFQGWLEGFGWAAGGRGQLIATVALPDGEYRLIER